MSVSLRPGGGGGPGRGVGGGSVGGKDARTREEERTQHAEEEHIGAEADGEEHSTPVPGRGALGWLRPPARCRPDRRPCGCSISGVIPAEMRQGRPAFPHTLLPSHTPAATASAAPKRSPPN